MAAGAAATVPEPTTWRKLAKAPAPGISTAHAPLSGGFWGEMMPELFGAKFSVIPRKPVSAGAKVAVVGCVGTCGGWLGGEEGNGTFLGVWLKGGLIFAN